MEKIRTGILGGSFDPVHNAHIAIANATFEQIPLDEIFFLPAHQAPLKDSPTLTSDTDRLNMLSLALRNFSHPYKIMDIEMRSNLPVNYSIDTIRILLKKYPQRRFFWIIGSDHLSKLKDWKDINTLSSLVEFAIVERDGYDIETALLPQSVRWIKINSNPLPHSSTSLRNGLRLSSHKCDFMLDESVKKYILTHNLYGCS